MQGFFYPLINHLIKEEIMQRKLLCAAVFLFIISIFTGNACAGEFTGNPFFR
ncbi:Uncharacterized protein dnl_17760 [Desulfonema limicola]|uniref:Uncharacterized protein n=1 Tax=Desulfonema limicola TaxID=45656 RepID=A0A975B696_9BACT|nr:Uncharacterized protein dnl_17760 [Desulfonema limicola]